MHVRMRDLRERALAVQRSCGHACGFVVARRFFRVPRTRRCVELRGHNSAIPRCIDGALGVMAVYKTGWANL